MRARAVAWGVGAAVAAGAGLIAGCGSGHTAAVSARVSTTSGGRPTSTTSTQAASVTSTTTPNPDLPGTGRPLVLLGDMNTPQQFIIGELYVQALQAQGYAVQLSRNIGPTSVSEAAIKQGSLDIYPEYLDVYDSDVAGVSRRFSSLASALDVARRYARAHGEALLAPTPFSQTAGVAVLASYARVHHLASIADLRRLQGGLTFGSPAEFSLDPAGLARLERDYGVFPALTTTITLGSQYRGLANESLQAAYDQTTDWQLSEPRYVSLTDSAHVFGFGNVVPVVSAKTLALEGPAFAATIDQVDALLSTRAIRGLTAETEASAEPAQASAEVAKEFLQGYGIVAPPPWSTVATTTPLTVTSITDTTPLTSTGRLSQTAPAG